LSAQLLRAQNKRDKASIDAQSGGFSDASSEIAEAESDLDAVESHYEPTAAEIKRLQDESISPLADIIEESVKNKFQRNIGEIKHYSMRSFIGNLLPDLAHEFRNPRKSYKAKIGNDGLHDYAEFYIAEWLEEKGFRPRFTEDSIQLAPPKEGSPDYNKQMVNYINTLISMNEAKNLMFGTEADDFKSLIEKITREDRYEQFKSDIDDEYKKKCSTLSTAQKADCYSERDMRKRKPVEKVQAQIDQYKADAEKYDRGELGRDRDAQNGALIDVLTRVQATLRPVCNSPGASDRHSRASCDPNAGTLPNVSNPAAPVLEHPEIASSASGPYEAAMDALVENALFSKGTCLNPLSLEKEEMKAEMRKALIGGNTDEAAEMSAAPSQVGLDALRALRRQPDHERARQDINALVEELERGSYFLVKKR